MKKALLSQQGKEVLAALYRIHRIDRDCPFADCSPYPDYQMKSLVRRDYVSPSKSFPGYDVVYRITGRGITTLKNHTLMATPGSTDILLDAALMSVRTPGKKQVYLVLLYERSIFIAPALQWQVTVLYDPTQAIFQELNKLQSRKIYGLWGILPGALGRFFPDGARISLLESVNIEKRGA